MGLKMNLFLALKERDYKFILLSQLFSDFGDWMVIPILAALVGYEWGFGGAELSLLAVCMALPSVLLGPLIGSFVDKSPPKKVMLCCDAVRAICAFSLVYIQNFYVFLIIIIIESIARTFFLPAKQVFIKATVKEDYLLSANSLSHTINQLAKVVSPALGGIMLMYWSYKIIFIINGLTFLISAFFLSYVYEIKAHNKAQKIFFLAKKSIEFLCNDIFLRSIMLLMGLRFAVIFLYDSFFVLLTKESNMSVAQYGLLISMIAMGSVIGAPMVSNFKINRKSSILCMIYGQMFGGLLILMSVYFGYINNIYFLFIWLLFGITNAFINIPYATSLQSNVEKEMIGRIFAVGESLQNFFMIIGPVIGYLIVSYLSAKFLFLICGFLLFLIGSYFLVMVWTDYKWKNVLGT